jgi:hypothetical protein
MVRRAAAGYDSRVAVLDEARARSALADMQDRLTRGPIVALGITSSSTPEDARAAFLQLTKQYHPVRFGRMAADIQKQANEVFLALRAAHDTVARTLRRQTGPIPSTPSPPASAAGNGRTVQGLPPRAAERPVMAPGATSPPPAGSTSGSLSGSGPRGIVRPSTPAGAPGPAAPSAPARAPGTARPGSAPPVTARDEAAVIDLLQRQQWDQARSMLHQLSAREPGSKRLRALECYARGREAQLDRRLDDARVELQDALDLDPDLQIAKTALTELFTRRK